MILTIDRKQGLECFVDTDFAGGFDKNHAVEARDCLSRTGYVIKYANCPIVWASKLQMTIALSKTEAKYMAMSIALREVLYLMNLMDKLRKFGVKLIDEKPIITCDVLEDNVGAIKLAKLPKLRPRTKHMAIQ